LRNPTWTSALIVVVPGEIYTVGSTITTSDVSSSPRVHVAFLDRLGTVIATSNALITSITGTTAARELTGQLTISAGVSSIRLTLLGFNPTGLRTSGTVWFDDVKMLW
jgi:hypothetical protein